MLVSLPNTTHTKSNYCVVFSAEEDLVHCTDIVQLPVVADLAWSIREGHIGGNKNLAWPNEIFSSNAP